MNNKKLLDTVKDILWGLLPLVLLWLGLFYEMLYMHSEVLGENYVLCEKWVVALDVSIIVLVYSLIPIKTGRWIGIPLALGAIYAIGNALYARYIVGYMPTASWLAFEQMNGLSDSVIFGMRWTDYAIVVLVLAIAFCAWKFIRGEKSLWLNYAIRVVILLGLTSWLTYDFLSTNKYFELNEEQWKAEHDYKIYWYREEFVAKHGIAYTCYLESQITNSDHRKLSEEETAQVTDFITRPAFAKTFEKPKNILFIITESLITTPIGTSIDGEPVTPTLDALIKDGVFCTNMCSEIKRGMSSDGQFIFFTGLLPRLTGVAVWDYLGNDLQGLGKLAKEQGYETLFLNCSNKTFWKQNSACLAYGEDTQYSVEDYKTFYGEEYPDPQMHDEPIFNMAYDITKKHSDKPMFLTVLTYSTHMPYNNKFWQAKKAFKSVENENYRNYLQKLNYTDFQIGAFLDKLKQDGLFDDLLIVVASDHPAPDDFAKGENDKIPLIIYGKGIEPKKIDEPLRQIDVYPTMMNLMGYTEKPYMGLGRSVFDLEGGIPRVDSDREKTKKISDMILEGDYFKKLF